MSALVEYKCPCCGGAIVFDSSLQKMKCPFCDTEFDVDTLVQYDELLKDEKPSEMVWDTDSESEWSDEDAENVRVYICTSCGGEIVCDDDTAATSCPFCDSPVMIQGNLNGSLRPDTVIPFKLDKEAAKERFREYLKGKRLLPSVFMSEAALDEIKGVYVPVWLFDANAEADIQFHATRTRGWSDGNYAYSEVSHYNLARSGSFAFRNIPVGGSSKIDAELLESLEPYNVEEAVEFNKGYLAGYLADKYDVTADQCSDRANERVTQSAVSMLRQTVDGGYNILETKNQSIRFNDGKSRYALYPVWMMTAKWEGESYRFAMNGQTGKFVGDLPMDNKKYWKYFGAVLGISAVIIYLLVHIAGCM